MRRFRPRKNPDRRDRAEGEVRELGTTHYGEGTCIQSTGCVVYSYTILSDPIPSPRRGVAGR